MSLASLLGGIGIGECRLGVVQGSRRRSEGCSMLRTVRCAQRCSPHGVAANVRALRLREPRSMTVARTISVRSQDCCRAIQDAPA